MESEKRLTIHRVALAALDLDAANARSHDERNLDAIRGSLARLGQESLGHWLYLFTFGGCAWMYFVGSHRSDESGGSPFSQAARCRSENGVEGIPFLGP